MNEKQTQAVLEFRETCRLREEAYRRTLAEVARRLNDLSIEAQMMNFGSVKVGLESLIMVLDDDFGPPMLFQDKLKEVLK